MTRAQLPPLPPGIRMLKNGEADMLARRQPSPFTVKNCVTCHGTKVFAWRDETNAAVEFDCPCADQYLLHRYLSHSGVLLNYQRLGWSDFAHLDDSVGALIFDYIDHQQHYVSAGFGLVLHGPRGNGKTLLGNLLTKRLIGDGVTCFATSFDDMVENFADGWRDTEQKHWFTRTVRNAQVLFIDDVGREYKADRFADASKTVEERRSNATADNRPGSMKETLLESVIRHRVGSCLPTIITTNLTEEQILHGYGGHTVSLLAEKSIFVNVPGIDRRPEMNRREVDLIKQGMTRPVVIA